MNIFLICEINLFVFQVPEILGAMTELEELWLDGNRLKTLPAMLGRFSKLRHLDASFNHLESVAPDIGNCTALINLTLSTNDLKVPIHFIKYHFRTINLDKQFRL